MKVGVLDHFDSMHSLPGHPTCGRPHGHTYTVEAVVEGEPVNGIVIDFSELKAGLREVLAEFDHANLNEVVPMPTCELLCREIHRRLSIRIPGKLSVRLWEGRGKWAECDGGP